jgi:uncharacterized RDD family membrane protein YckC
LKCEKCGSDINEMSNSCSNCGFAPQMVTVELYAGFWKRFIARLLDSIVLVIPLFIVFIIFAVLINGTAMLLFFGDNTMDANPALDIMFTIVGLIPILLIFILELLYFAVFESSSWQATPGKKIIGVKVTDLQGERITLGKAILRNVGRIASSVLYIGYIIIGFTQKKQGLHDMIAGTLVVNAD